MKPLSSLARSGAEHLLFALGVLLSGLGISGGMLAWFVWRQSIYTPSLASRVVFDWTLAAGGFLPLGVGLLVLYRRLRGATIRPGNANPVRARPSSTRAGRWTSTLAVLRVLTGGLLVLLATGCLFYGLIGVVLRVASAPVWWAGANEDAEALRLTAGIALLGVALVWAGYVCLTGPADLDAILREERQSQLLTFARRFSHRPGNAGNHPATAGSDSFGWRGLPGRALALWLGTWLAGAYFHAWGPDPQGFATAAATAVLYWLGVGGIILVHELGHWLGAELAGVRCVEIRVGQGPALLRARLPGGAKLALRAWPTDGRTHLGFDREGHFRLSYAVVYAGGPLAHALLIAGLVWSASAMGPTHGFPLAVLALLGGWILVTGSLIPYRLTRQGGGGTESILVDSAGLLNAPRLPAWYVRWRVGTSLACEAAAQACSPHPELQRTGAENLAAAVARYPEDILVTTLSALTFLHRELWDTAAASLETLLNFGGGPEPMPGELGQWARTERVAALAMAGHAARARAECLESLQSDEPAGVKTNRLDRLACLPIMQGLDGYAEEALDWVERALVLDPGRVTLKGTRGSLLVEAGRLEEGRALLDEVRATTKSDLDQGICALFLAIVARRQNKAEEAALLVAEALRLCPGRPWMAARWERELKMPYSEGKDG